LSNVRCFRFDIVFSFLLSVHPPLSLYSGFRHLTKKSLFIEGIVIVSFPCDERKEDGA
jgi:hypothetical protein